ncbi:phosphatase and actin regulator 2 [Trichonephila clavipes]|nr:phosphatase and actin regulator 2 [Trichonephila clavipes]
MKTSSVEFISRSPNPLPMKSKHRRFVLLRKIFEPWQWKRRKKRNRFEQTSRTLQRKISMRSTKDQLVKKDVLMPVKHNVFLWNLPDVEEVPSHDGETILLWSPWTYRCGQRTVRLAVMACSQNQAVFARRRSELKLKLELVEEKQKLLDIRAGKERSRKGERERCASRRYLLHIIVKLIC